MRLFYCCKRHIRWFLWFFLNCGSRTILPSPPLRGFALRIFHEETFLWGRKYIYMFSVRYKLIVRMPGGMIYTIWKRLASRSLARKVEMLEARRVPFAQSKLFQSVPKSLLTMDSPILFGLNQSHQVLEASWWEYNGKLVQNSQDSSNKRSSYSQN